MGSNDLSRPPTIEDVIRWQALIAKVREASQSLVDANELLGKLILTIDNDDAVSWRLVNSVGKLLEQACMSVSVIRQPVTTHWCGGSNKDDIPQTLHWGN